VKHPGILQSSAFELTSTVAMEQVNVKGTCQSCYIGATKCVDGGLAEVALVAVEVECIALQSVGTGSETVIKCSNATLQHCLWIHETKNGDL
jgi:hypothetical protein